MEIAKAYGIKNGKSKTVGPKYSSNLKANPMGSFNLMNPEMVKNIPTNMRQKPTNILIIYSSVKCIKAKMA